MSRSTKHLAHGHRDGILIPKELFRGVSATSLKRFCTASEAHLATEFCKTLRLPRRYCWKTILQALEATAFLEEMPPLLLANLNFVTDMAQPAGASRSHKTRRAYRDLQNQYPLFSSIGSKITEALKGGSTQRDYIFPALNILDLSEGDDQLLCRIAHFYANDYIKTPDTYRTRFRKEFHIADKHSAKSSITTVSTDRKVIQTLPDALHLLRDGQLNCRMTSALRLAAGVVWASQLVRPHTDFLNAYSSPVIRLPREISLISPNEILCRYAIDTPPPSRKDLQVGKADIEAAAFRVLRSVLVHGWQRHCSLIHLKLSDFILDGSHPEVHILWTKTGLVNQSLPLWGIMPDDELTGLRAFMEFCEQDLRLPGETRLTQLAGFGEFGEATSFVGQKRFCEAMGKLVPEFLESTHLPRAMGLSWAPVRALAALHPSVLTHPTLANLRSHPWFSPGELVKFRTMLAASSTDSVELFRRIACWSTTEQFVSTYCRSSHLLLQLWCFLQDSNLQ